MTGLLVRSAATQWSKGSVLAVDAGTHLAAIINIIREHLPHAVSKYSKDAAGNGASVALHAHSHGYTNGTGARTPTVETANADLVLSTGPFAGFELQSSTAKANGAYFIRNLITTHLITHPHLDHISGFVINTAGFQHTSRPKRLAGLPATIDAFKSNIFNDIIWPNLSDEDGGVGLVSYMRLAEGGNIAIGEGEGRGYIEVCDGLAVKAWSVSHGKCMHNHSKRGSGSGNTQESFTDSISRRPSANVMIPGAGVPNHGGHAGWCVTDSSAFFLRDEHTGNEILIFGDVEPDSLSLSPRTAQVWSDAAPKIANGLLKGIFIECSYDESQSDDMLFGHLAPRHVIEELQVLADKVRIHKAGMNMDAPSSDSTAVDTIGGSTKSKLPFPLKRKRGSEGTTSPVQLPQQHHANSLPDIRPPSRRGRRTSSTHGRAPACKSRKSGSSPSALATSVTNSTSDFPEDYHEQVADSNDNDDTGRVPTPITLRTITEDSSVSAPASTDLPSSIITAAEGQDLPLAGVQVVIVHVKDNLRDGPEVGDTILQQLQEHERNLRGQGKGAGLGCEFRISKCGEGIWL